MDNIFLLLIWVIAVSSVLFIAGLVADFIERRL